MKTKIPAMLPALALLLSASASQAQYSKYDSWEENYTVQALLGAVQFENLKFQVEDSATPEEVDMALLPQLGGAWSTLPKDGPFQVGLEASFLLGFRFDDINYLSAGGSGLYVSLSTSLWMFDIAGGAYANLFLGEAKRLRLYVGGGPLLVFADYDAEKEYSDTTTPDEDTGDSAFGIGVYARTGFEFRIHQKGMLGLGARGTWSDVDFSDVGGESDLVGLALFATYTAGF